MTVLEAPATTLPTAAVHGLAAGGAVASITAGNAPEVVDTPAASQPVTTGTLMLWDGPNLQITVQEMCGGTLPRFDYRHLVTWLRQRTPAGEPVDPVLFLNIHTRADGNVSDALRQFVHSVRQVGVGVWARPKQTADDDVDDNIVEMAAASNASAIVLATHDKGLIHRVRAVAPNARLTVLAVREKSCYALGLDGVAFVDIEEIKDFVGTPIPRAHNLHGLPAGGMLLPALVRTTGK